MQLLQFSPDEFKLFLLVFTRLSIVLFMFPFLGSETIPAIVKIGLGFLLAMLLFPVVTINPMVFPDSLIHLSVLLIQEGLIGLTLGLALRLFFASVQLASQMIGFQMGFAMINVIDPQTGANVSIMDQIGYWTVLLIFILLNGHFFFISGIVKSFESVPMGAFVLEPDLVMMIVKLAAAMFDMSIRIGAPAVAALLFASVGFGICAKFVPQMPILIVAFPVKIAIGLLFYGLVLQVILLVTRSYVNQFPEMMSRLFGFMG